jgi:hypothetical protein
MILKADRISDEKLDALDEQHDGRILHAWQPAIPRRGKDAPEGAAAWEAVFRAPSRREMMLFQQSIDSAASAATRALAPENLARACVIHVTGSTKPAAEAFGDLVERFPGIPAYVGTGLARLAGFVIDQHEKL